MPNPDILSAGVHSIPAKAYHADPCEQPSLSASIAHHLVNHSPLHAWSAHPRLNPNFKREERAAFDLGTVAHELLLEGTTERLHEVEANDWRTKLAQEVRDEARANGLIPLLSKDIGRVREMVAAVRANLAERRDDDPPILADGKPEQTIVWEENGVTCRALVDWLRDDFIAIDDLKTTARSASPAQWARTTLWSIGADIQVAFNMRGVKAVTGIEPQFRYVLVECTPPYAVSVVSLASSAIELGKRKAESAIARWRECLETNTWPGYPGGVYLAETPSWEEVRWLEQEAEVALV